MEEFSSAEFSFGLKCQGVWGEWLLKRANEVGKIFEVSGIKMIIYCKQEYLKLCVKFFVEAVVF